MHMTQKENLALDSRSQRDAAAQHTGQHLLSGTIFHMTGSQTVSMHIGEETCTIDVDPPVIDEQLLILIEEAVADKIEENLPVIIHLCPPEDVTAFPLRKFPPQGEDVIRVVEISGLDFSPCSGTHLGSTAEIGALRILNAEKYKGMARITFIAGRRVLKDSRRLRQNAATISRALSAPVNETGNAVLEFLEKANHAERRLKLLVAEAAKAKAQVLVDKAAASGKPPVIERYPDEDIAEVLTIGKIAKSETKKLIILVSEKDNKFAAFCEEENTDLRVLFKETFAAFGGKGGGSQTFFQGSFSAKDDLDAFLLELEK